MSVGTRAKQGLEQSYNHYGSAQASTMADLPMEAPTCSL
jgi:hypothetical protein